MPSTIVGSNGRAHPLYDRPEWGARAPRHVSRMRAPQVRKFVHYAVVPARGPEPTLAQSFAAVRAIQAFHMDSRGWSDIAYSIMADNAGRLFVARGPRVVGGHTQGWNSKSVAVCWIGMPGDPFTDAAKSGIRAALEWLDRLDGVRTPTDGHRDVASTACPGDPAYEWVHLGMPVDGGNPNPQPEPDPQELTVADIATILGAIENVEQRLTELEQEVASTRTDVGSWLQGERSWNGTAGYRIAGRDAVHVLSFAPTGPFLTRLSPALFAALQARGDLDPAVFDVAADDPLVAELEAMPGFDPR